MKSKHQKLLGIFAVCLAAVNLLRGQGTFQNLDFENPKTPLVPEPPFSFVPITSALPSWTGYLGTDQQTLALYNNMFVGTAALGLLGPGWPGGTISGNYTALLQAGVDPLNSSSIVNAAIGQTGLIPASAKSLQFQLRGNDFLLQLNGQVLPVVSIFSGANYVVYGADVSSFAGQVAELRFTAVSTQARLFNNVFLDSFVFSPEPLPEPSTFGLLGFGVLLLGWRRFSKRL